MMLNDYELKNVVGGGLSSKFVLAIGALGVFIAGVIDGFINPLKCNR